MEELKSLVIHDSEKFHAARRGRRHVPWKWIFLAVLLMGGGALFWFYRGGRPATVQVMEILVSRGFSGSVILTGGGYVISKTETVIGPKISGRIRELVFEEGQRVKKGEVLVRLEDDEAKAQLELAKANLKEAKANLERAKGLMAEKIISPADYDRAKTDYEVKKAQKKLAQAQWQDTRIISPINGVVLDRMVEVGEIVSPYQELGVGKARGIYKLADADHLQVEVDISEAEIRRIYLGQGVVVWVDAAGSKSYKGKVEEIAPMANRQKGTVQVKVRIVDVDDKIKPEMSAKLTFLSEKEVPLESLSAKISVPQSSVYPVRGRLPTSRRDSTVADGRPASNGVHQNGAPYVFIFKDGKAIQRMIELGKAEQGQAEVKKGLEEGDFLIVESSKPILDGMRVKLGER